MCSAEEKTDEYSHHSAVGWLLLLLAMLVSMSAGAQDCSLNSINLHDQPAVDAFQANYGPCTRVPIDLNIEDFSTPGNEIVDLTPLSGLTEVGNILFIGSTSVTSLAGLESLVSVRDFYIYDNPNLVNLTGLSGLTSVDLMSVRGNNLSDLSGLSSGLTSIDRLSLGEFHLSGLPASLTHVRRFVIEQSAVTDLSGLPTLLQSEEVTIFLTTELTSLNGLPAFQGLKSISLEYNDALSDISALAASSFNLTNPEEIDIRVELNFSLSSLDGLPAVPKVGYLAVRDNPNLITLGTSIGVKESWGVLSVMDNDNLADCSILRTVLDDTDDGDPGPGTSLNPDDPPDTLGLAYLTIENNAPFDPDLPPPIPSCNSIAEILAAPSDLIHADGFEGG
jgi:hypothetical protein